MKKKNDVRVELRYYEIPQNEYVLALLGDSWNRIYHNEKSSLHFHNLMEIGFCHDGEGEMIFDNDSVFHYGDGSFTIIPQNVPHNTWSYGERTNYWEFLYIDVGTILAEMYRADKIFAHELTERVNRRAFVCSENDKMALSNSIRAILEEKREKQEFSAEIEKCLVQRLLLEVARLNPIEKEKGDQPQKRRKIIIDSLDFINENYMKNIKISELSVICHMSETHFRRLFEETIQMMPVDYINFFRIQKACEYLSSSNDSIENAALKVGYISQSTFNRNFNKFVGVSPRKWKTASESYKLKLLNYKITALKGW